MSDGQDMAIPEETSELFASLVALDPIAREEMLRKVARHDAARGALLARLVHAAEGMVVQTRILTDLSPDQRPLAGQPPLAAGDMIGGFELVERLGAGGMGEVWSARQRVPSRMVALKVIALGQRRVQWLAALRERDVLAALRHPAIATIHAAGEEHGRAWIAIELVEGARNLVEATRGLPIVERARLVAEVAEAVAHAHASGLIHRDLKPSNVLVGRDGRPKVIDFGIASDGRETHDPLALCGTPAYLAPESLAVRAERADTPRGGPDAQPELRPPTRPDARADVRALGVLLHQCVHGSLPPELSQQDPVAVLAALHTVKFEPPRDAPRAARGDLARIVARATAADPEKRYPTASAFAEDLRAFLLRKPIAAAPRGAFGRTLLLARRHPAAATMAVTLAATLLGATLTSLWYAAYARTAALEAAALAEQTADVYTAFLSLTVPSGQDGARIGEQSLHDYLRGRVVELERQATRIASTDQLRGVESNAQTLQYACLSFGLKEEAVRCSIARELVAARLDDKLRFTPSIRHLDRAYTRLAIDPADPAALAALESLVPEILSEQRIVRAGALSRIAAVDYLDDPILSERVAGLLLRSGGDDPEVAMSAASRTMLATIDTLARKAPVGEAERDAFDLAVAVLRTLRSSGDPAVEDQARSVASGCILALSRLVTEAPAPILMPSLVELALVAGSHPAKGATDGAAGRAAANPPAGVVRLDFAETLPIRLIQAGAFEGCRSFLDALDRRGVALAPVAERRIARARADLVIHDGSVTSGVPSEGSVREAMRILARAAQHPVPGGGAEILDFAALVVRHGELAASIGDFAAVDADVARLSELREQAARADAPVTAEVYESAHRRLCDIRDALRPSS